MEEIEVENNPLGIKIYVNGQPSIDNMSDEEYDLFVSSLELRMSDYTEKSNTDKS